MKIGLNLLLWSDAPVFDKHQYLLDLAHEIGFDCLEFPVYQMSGDAFEKFGKKCDELGLARTALAVFDSSAYDPISPDKSMRQAAIKAIDDWSAKAVDLGANMLVGPFFQGLAKFTGAPATAEEWKRGLDSLHEAGVLAGKRGVRLALEVVNRFEIYFINTLDEGKRFVKELGLPNVGLLADTMHSNIEELDVPQAFYDALPELIHVHISECNRGTPGSGHAISQELFKKLKAGGYEGYLTIEAFHGGATPSLISPLHLWRSARDNAEEIARKGYKFIRDSINAL